MAVPDRIGAYRLDEEIGRGALGKAFKAHDLTVDRAVAVKLTSPNWELDAAQRSSFMREAHAISRLNHPRIIRVHDVGEECGAPYLVTELIEGVDLRTLVAERRVVEIERKVAMMIEVCDALDHAHKRGVVHRCVAPRNIHVLRDGHVKLDFGISHIVIAARMGPIIGVSRYMAPEDFGAGGHADHRASIFVFGCVCYAFLCFRDPFAGNSAVEIVERLHSEEVPRLDRVEPTISPELAVIVERALKKDPAERYADFGAMRADLQRVTRVT